MKGKLIFRYGTMGSAKTANLLTTAFNFEERHKHVICLKPSIDTRFKQGYIKSRIEGLERPCYSVHKSEKISGKIWEVILDNSYNPSNTIILIDEVQFLTPSQIDELVELVDNSNLFIICYGLRTDSTGHLFPGSKRLFEMADTIEEIKSVCDCGRKTIINAKLNDDGTFTINNDKIVDVGGNEKYKAVCRTCWKKNIDENK